MIGLALSGGGSRGSYEVGAYLAFKKCHIKFDGYVGTSIGSFNAAMLAAGRDKELKRFWENVNIGKLIGFKEDYLKKLDQEKKSNTLLEHMLNNAQTIIKNKGFSTSGLYKILQELNLEPAIRKQKKDFGLVTVRQKKLESVYKFIEDIPEGKLNDYILASCYLPVFKKEKLIDNDYYLDGGFRDNAPVQMLLDKGYKKIYVVDLHAIGIKRRIKAKDQKKLEIISPSHNLKSILNTNQEDLKYNIKLGYYDTLKKLKNLDGEKYIFTRYSKDFYKFLTRKVKKSTLKEMQVFFKTKDIKEIVLKSLEMAMLLNKYAYTEIYNPVGVIRKMKRLKHKKGIYQFIYQLKFI